ncbi:hypothetical protein [Pelagicoccus albus]|uniref:VPDSG-CTERM protein sorting domain-containing protein n=1 Tax=Pelagicoccus albus TaxID=415222 RepID=A0A7X1B2R5_9BACT|nr:hypothetical protein [Pelagicoccus albus]MBC2604589.1 hypothetical protein [Pelagicoccus albus]
MFSKNKAVSLLSGSLLLATAVSGLENGVEETLHIDLGIVADFNYDLLGFDAKEYVEYLSGPMTDQEFEDLYPIFRGASDYYVNGFGSLEYDFYNTAIDSSFDLGEAYDWQVSVTGAWGVEGMVSTPEAPFFEYFGASEGDLEFEFSIPGVAAVDLFQLTSLDSLELATSFSALLAAVPGSEGLNDALTLAGSALALLPVITGPDAVDVYADAGFPYGFIDIAINGPLSIPEGPDGPLLNGPLPEFINALDYLTALGIFDISVSATRNGEGTHTVPDATSTMVSALLGFLVLILIRRRHQNA